MQFFRSKEIITKNIENANLICVEGELLKKIQSIEREMLFDVNQICEENGIDIFLGGGTLLGAIRHKGFIPWDDDIDLNIKRKDVNKFLELIKNRLSDKYKIRYLNKEAFRPFIKIEKKDTVFYEIDYPEDDVGITIDLFIIEDLPKSKVMILIYGLFCTVKLFIASCLSVFENRNNEYIKIVRSRINGLINYWIKKSVGFVFSFETYLDRIIKNDKFFSKYNGNQCDYICIPTGRNHFFGEIYTKELYEEYINVDFDGLICKAPKLYDLYLKNLYGNGYMEMPPIEKREHHYVFKIKL